MGTRHGIQAASDGPEGTEVGNGLGGLWGTVGRGGRVRQQESTGLPKGLVGLLVVLVAGSATAAV